MKNPIVLLSNAAAGLGCLLLATVAGAQDLPTTENLSLDAVETPAGPSFSIVFTDDGTGASDYALEFTPAVGPDAEWTVDNSAVVSAIGGNQYRATLTRPVDFGAYRLVAYDASGELTGQFASPTIELSEDESGLTLLVLFSQPFTGTLNYTVGGTATGQFDPFTGSVTVNNATTAKIPVALTDDSVINELRFLTLDIENANGLVGGANSQLLINVIDNDAIWNGSILFDELELGFDYRQTSDAGVYQATLVSDGTGALPAGEYPAQTGANQFPATISGIRVPSINSALGEQPTMTIVLNVVEGTEDHLLSDTEIRGDATFSTSYSGKPHLDVTKSGRFILLKPSPEPSTAEVDLAANAD